jgi:hypothetical protein
MLVIAALFAMGVLAVTVSAQWTWPLVKEGLLEPIKIAAAVLVAGLLVKFLRPAVRTAVSAAIATLGVKAFAFAVVVILGLVSSVITAIIAACFAIGMGRSLLLSASRSPRSSSPSLGESRITLHSGFSSPNSGIPWCRGVLGFGFLGTHLGREAQDKEQRVDVRRPADRSRRDGGLLLRAVDRRGIKGSIGQ